MRYKLFIDKMTSLESGVSNSSQTEKPHHYTYLKEFRTQQCPLFLQHKCTQHRPFTCFHWHFMNQRRRRPIRKKDGMFSYSPDNYCTKYDETTGICPDGDDCMFLHRTSGDTERRYHLRYYKTSVCVHETDSKGHCVKNGPHCAFAHGPADLRPPVYDFRELQEGAEESPLASSLEKEKMINEDPRWNDTRFVLLYYKTELCKRPPRLCRQGYACPSYHNTRDRRRCPTMYSYRSTPCPHVKHGDDWGDPSLCDSADQCRYCHTRTEQQFHPEIYKSTKCNDMIQAGYCPRGPFCAFAHAEQEMSAHRDLHLQIDNSLAAFVANVLPEKPKLTPMNSFSQSNGPRLDVFNGLYSSSFPEGRLRNGDHSISRAPGSERSSDLASSLSPRFSMLSPRTSSMSPLARVFYPAGDTVESVVGNALEDDELNIGELSMSLEKDLGLGFDDNEGIYQGSLLRSLPISIPRTTNCLFPTLPSLHEDEEQRLRQELSALKKKMAAWEQGYSQAREACQAWQLAVDEANNKVLVLSQEAAQLRLQRDEAIQQSENSQGFLHCIQKMNELEFVPLPHLKQLQVQLRLDMDTLDKIVYSHATLKCSQCDDKPRCNRIGCNHYVLCENCNLRTSQCPICSSNIKN